MATTLKQLALSPVAVSGLGGSSLASGSNAISDAIDPTGLSWGSSQRVRYVFTGTFGGAPTAGAAIRIYALISTDGGTTYETDNGRSATPVKIPIAVIWLGTGTTQTRTSAVVDLPIEAHKLIVENNGTGQTLASGWALSAIPQTDQGV